MWNYFMILVENVMRIELTNIFCDFCADLTKFTIHLVLFEDEKPIKTFIWEFLLLSVFYGGRDGYNVNNNIYFGWNCTINLLIQWKYLWLFKLILRTFLFHIRNFLNIYDLYMYERLYLESVCIWRYMQHLFKSFLKTIVLILNGP